jgi:hypothetical protein
MLAGSYMKHPRVWLIVAPKTTGVIKQACNDLQIHLQHLFGVELALAAGQSSETFSGYKLILGQITDVHVQQACRSLPTLTPQGHLLRRMGTDSLVLAGGSDPATAWAAYELLEQYGIRFLLHEDALPPRKTEFYLPDVDTILEPVDRLRIWRMFSGLSIGPEFWSLKQQRLILRQLFKLKFNGVLTSLWPHQPVVDYQYKGIRRKTAELFFGQKFPLDESIQPLFNASPFLMNSEFAGAETYQEKLRVGQELIHGILDYAKSLGMYTTISFNPFEFPKEFGPLLQCPNTEPVQLGDLTCAERGDLHNPGHMGLIHVIFQAYLQEYQNIDEILLSLPEFPQADAHFAAAWRALDARFSLEPRFRAAELMSGIESECQNTGYAQTRALKEFQSNISMLNFLHLFFAEYPDVMENATTRNMRIGLALGSTPGSTAMFPLLDRILWPKTVVHASTYTPSSGVAQLLPCMNQIDTSRIEASLVLTLQDDNIGWMPQVSTSNNALLLEEIRNSGWRGYSTRFWPLGDLDPAVAHLSKSSWDRTVSAASACQDHFLRLYGAYATPIISEVTRLLENATFIAELCVPALYFPILGTMTKYLKPFSWGQLETIARLKSIYQNCQRLLIRIPAVESETGSRNLNYLRARLEFAINALSESIFLINGARELSLLASTADQQENRNSLLKIERLFQNAILSGQAAAEAAKSCLRDESDWGNLGTYHYLFIKEVQEAIENTLNRFRCAKCP